MTLEDLMRSWGAAPSATEQEKMGNAETAIRKAISSHDRLSGMDISIIPQGSYRSKTNVRQDSDVDVCVCLNSTFFPHYPPGKAKEHYGHIDGSISFKAYKDLIQEALVDHFGASSVVAGGKAFDVHSNSYRIDADVVPAFAHRHYFGETANDYVQPVGIEFSTAGGRIINWPHQAYENGKLKHDQTGRRFRKMVRILKRLRNEMQEERIAEADNIASFLIESMVWNVPDAYFNHDDYLDDVRDVIAYCFNETLPAGGHASLYEVNRRKKLFGAKQPWTVEATHTFFSKAWNYLGFE